ncbi:30s ribosomal protein s6 [Gracilaria domingensis]|nr:30s ribosomal protein s6 [Gracilaria domingensis]
MPYYELLCLAKGNLPRKELGSLLHKTCRAFMDNGAIVTRIRPLGATGNGPRDLAYRIRINQVSYHKGFFVNVCAFASPQTLAEVNRQLKIDERVLRHLAIRKPIREAVKPIPDIDQGPPRGGRLNLDDPERALQEFLAEYERDFAKREEEDMDDKELLDIDDVSSKPQTQASGEVNEVVAGLKAWSKAEKPKKDHSLSWLSGLKGRPS